MESLVGRKVLEIQTYENLFLSGLGHLERVLPSQSKSLKLEMKYAAEGVLVVAGVVNSAKKTTFLVPWASIKTAVIE